jgi:hypothetical protein
MHPQPAYHLMLCHGAQVLPATPAVVNGR